MTVTLRPSPRLLCGTLGLWAVLAVPVPWAAGQDRDAAAGDPPAGEGAEKAAGAGGGLSSITKLIPKGKVHKGVVYPMFESGVLTTVITSGELVRHDSENLDIKTMKIEIFDKVTGKTDFVIDLKTAIYHLASEQLSSDDKSLIRGRDFTIHGDSLAFDTQSGRGRLVGNVKMVIENLAGFMPPTPETSPPANKDADPPPPAGETSPNPSPDPSQ